MDGEKHLSFPFLVMLLVVLFVMLFVMCLVMLPVVMLGDDGVLARPCAAQAGRNRGLQTDLSLKTCSLQARVPLHAEHTPGRCEGKYLGRTSAVQGLHPSYAAPNVACIPH